MNKTETAQRAETGETHREWQLRRAQELARKPLVTYNAEAAKAAIPTDWDPVLDDVDEFLASVRRPEEAT